MRFFQRARHGLAPVLLLAAVLASGCASGSGPAEWQKRVGQMTYDEAVREYGPPDKKESLTDGSMVAEWLTHRGQVYSTPAPVWGGWGGWGGWGWRGRWYGGAMGMDVNSTPDRYLRLQFGADGRLKEWKRLYK